MPIEQDQGRTDDPAVLVDAMQHAAGDEFGTMLRSLGCVVRHDQTTQPSGRSILPYSSPAAGRARAPAVNLVTRIAGGGPGRRLVFNGHLDTFPRGDAASWTRPPLGGIIEDGRIYGRGAADMKAGLAASILAALLLAERRDAWRGEI